MNATASFVIDNWEQDPLDEGPGAPMARARLAKTFTGDLEGTSVAEILIAGDPQDEAARAYVGIERITGALAGRSGSFVLIHSAVATSDGPEVAWTILPDSGTGELTGISGRADLSIDDAGGHAITLDYTL